MLVAIIAGALYAAVAFLIGFIFGTLRVMVLVPALSDLTAVLLELPFILLASWFVCRWCVDRLGVSIDAGPRPYERGRLRGTDGGGVWSWYHLGSTAYRPAGRFRLSGWSHWPHRTSRVWPLPSRAGVAPVAPQIPNVSTTEPLVSDLGYYSHNSWRGSSWTRQSEQRSWISWGNIG